jgi:hypothetical protein
MGDANLLDIWDGLPVYSYAVCGAEYAVLAGRFRVKAISA